MISLSNISIKASKTGCFEVNLLREFVCHHTPKFVQSEITLALKDDKGVFFSPSCNYKTYDSPSNDYGFGHVIYTNLTSVIA